MKKTVSILVFFVYLISIVTVSLLGIQVVIYNPTVYATEIKCTNEEYNPATGRIVLKYTVGIEYQLKWEITPENTTNKEVIFPYETEGKYNISNTGYLTVYKRNSFMIKILVADGSNVNIIIDFIFY